MGKVKRKLAILAGSGVLPALAAHEALANNWPVHIYAVAEEDFANAPGGEDLKALTTSISITRFGQFLKTLKKDGITHLVMLGKVSKEHIFKELRFDLRALWVMGKMVNKNDDSFFHAAEAELRKVGVEVIPQPRFLSSLMLPSKVYTRKKPGKKDWQDIKFGMYYAKKIGGLDIGQTVVVRNRSILAVEAIEGTDRCISRVEQFAQKNGAVVCKTEKKSQDDRFDVPTVGLSTLEAMKDAHCHVLAIEAKKTFVVTPKEVIERANKLGMIFLAAEPVDSL